MVRCGNICIELSTNMDGMMTLNGKVISLVLLNVSVGEECLVQYKDTIC